VYKVDPLFHGLLAFFVMSWRARKAQKGGPHSTKTSPGMLITFRIVRTASMVLLNPSEPPGKVEFAGSTILFLTFACRILWIFAQQAWLIRRLRKL
jgi:hypothetical protein